MNFELRAAQERFEREQRERLRKARLEAERKRKSQEEARKRQIALQEAQRSRRLEEAAQREAAKAREEAELLASDGIRYKRNFKIIPISGEGDKITLPNSAFSELLSQNAIDKGPMYFELNHKMPGTCVGSSPDDVIEDEYESDTKINTHVGVLEFTAPEGCVGLPPHVLSCLDQSRGSNISTLDQLIGCDVSIRYVRLPKCKYAKLQPLQSSFFGIPNHKAILEAKLRNHSTLTVGDKLKVFHMGVDYELTVALLKPENAVSVIDTDMEVDIEPLKYDAGTVDTEIIPLTLGKTEEGFVTQGQYRYYRVGIPENSLSDLIGRNSELKFELNISEDPTIGDADLYATLNPVVLPSHRFHQWRANEIGSKSLRISEFERGASSSNPLKCTLGVHGFHGSSKFTLTAAISNAENLKERRKASTAESHQVSNDASRVLCSNCQQFVPVNSLFLHEAYCMRHNVRCLHEDCGIVLKVEEMQLHKHCEQCGMALTQKEVPKHMQLFHSLLHCPCGIALPMKAMTKHSAEECPLRIINCRFCGDYVPANGDALDARDRMHGLTSHESLCGSRTALCDFCSRSFMLKEMDLHIRAVHSEFQPQPQPQPRVASEPQPRKPSNWTPDVSSFQKSMNVFCPICGASAHSERDLSAHIDVAH